MLHQCYLSLPLKTLQTATTLTIYSQGGAQYTQQETEVEELC